MRAAEKEGGQEDGIEGLRARVESLRDTQKRLVAELQAAIERSKQLHYRLSGKAER